MSINRIQKLLFSEYCDFEDMVLVESSFAQTTREGRGIRQVHLGLTPSKLVLATDILPSAKDSLVTYVPGIDPDIETFELVAVYPVECVNLSVFHHRKRQSLKAHFCNNRVLYFELGGFEKRNMLWNLWRERVKFLSPEAPGSSHSETSVATSTSNSTLYMLMSKKFLTEEGLPQFWCRYSSGDSNHVHSKWTDRYLFLGAQLDESPLNYAPGILPPTISQFLRTKAPLQLRQSSSTPSTSLTRDFTKEFTSTGDVHPVNRFASGVVEGCSTSLFLPAENYIVPRRFSQSTTMSSDMLTNKIVDVADLIESSVKLWEMYKETDPNKYKKKHKRRYGFAPQPYFLHGLGPWNVAPGARYSVQIKRAVSSVNIRRQPTEPELRLSISKRQLIASISCEALHLDTKMQTTSNTIKNSPKNPVIFFWTPEYWYRPRSARDAYKELQEHLKQIHQCHKKLQTEERKKRKLFRRKRLFGREFNSDSEDEIFFKNKDKLKAQKRSSTKLFNIFASRQEEVYEKDTAKKEPQETSIQFLRRVLRMEMALTAWDFDSTTLAHQLTVIDKELFLKIQPTELSVLVWQQSSKNAPNIGALIAFSHRISCLVATEVLKDDSDKIRARLIARFINAAEKCNKICNFQTCKSILCGLQSPAIYRLHATWTYVRKRHATKYLIFENLCRQYRDPRLPAYQRVFFRATQSSPYLPFIGDLIARLLDRVPNFGSNLTRSSSSALTCKKSNSDQSVKKVSSVNLKSTPQQEQSTNTILKKLLCSLKGLPASETVSQAPLDKVKQNKVDNSTQTKQSKHVNSLIDYFKPLSCYEDNRIERLNEAIELLEKFQIAASNYSIRRNELAQEYLLKARYREDKENFVHSFSVEPLNFVDIYRRNK